MIALIIATLLGTPSSYAQVQPRLRIPFTAPCSAVERLPDGQWRTKTAISFGANEVPADTFIGAGGNVDYVLVNGELINTDIADKCASRPG